LVKVLFDTSVLIAALVVSHPQHAACFPRLKAAQSKQIQGFISTHTLAEAYSVLTRLPFSPASLPNKPKASSQIFHSTSIEYLYFPMTIWQLLREWLL
jgi:predicted nucleic acid-binding protein